MTKTMAGSEQGGSGFWAKVKFFLEGLEGFDEPYQAYLERRVSHLEMQVARLVATETPNQATQR